MGGGGEGGLLQRRRRRRRRRRGSVALRHARMRRYWHPAAGKEPYQLEVPQAWLDNKALRSHTHTHTHTPYTIRGLDRHQLSIHLIDG